MSSFPPPPPSENPYQAPQGGFGEPTGDYTEYARARLAIPSLLLMILTGLELLELVLFFGFYAIGLVVTVTAPPVGEMPASQRVGEIVGGLTAMAVISFLLVSVRGLIFWGAWKMRALESHPLAMTASILALFPCSYCCVLGLPLGIWSLIVLADPYVRQEFK